MSPPAPGCKVLEGKKDGTKNFARLKEENGQAYSGGAQLRESELISILAPRQHVILE
jgi:hypothetical protein